MNNLSLGRTDS